MNTKKTERKIPHTGQVTHPQLRILQIKKYIDKKPVKKKILLKKLASKCLSHELAGHFWLFLSSKDET